MNSFRQIVIEITDNEGDFSIFDSRIQDVKNIEIPFNVAHKASVIEPDVNIMINGKEYSVSRVRLKIEGDTIVAQIATID